MWALPFFCAFTPLAAVPAEEYRTFRWGEWHSFGVVPGVFLAPRDTLGGLLDESPAVVEEPSPFADRRRFCWAEGFERDPATLAALKEAGVFISPELWEENAGRVHEMAVYAPTFSLGIRYGDWEAVFSDVLAAVGGVVSVRVFTSPLGTERDSYPHFSGRLEKMGVELEPPAEMDWGDFPGPPPGPPPGFEREPDMDGTAGFGLRIEAHIADDVFEAIARAAGVAGVRYAEPSLLVRAFTAAPVGVGAAGLGWGRDPANTVWIWSPPPGAPEAVRYRMDEGWIWSGAAAAEARWHWNFDHGAWADGR